MVAFPTLLGNVALFALLAVPGYLMGKQQKPAETALPGISNILMYVAMPFLVFSKLLETDIRALRLRDLLCCGLLPFLLALCLLALSGWIFRKWGDPTHRAANRFCAAFPNCGFWGIPLASALFPDAPEVTVYVSIFNVFNTFLLLTAGVCILSGGRKKVRLKNALVSPITIAIILGFALSALGVGGRMPMVRQYAAYLAQLATPLSMLALGMECSRVRLRRLFTNREMYAAAALRLIASPVLAMGLLWLFHRLCGAERDPLVFYGILIAAAVSTAASAPAMAAKYGADGAHAAAVAVGSTILCVFTLPVLLFLLQTLPA